MIDDEDDMSPSPSPPAGYPTIEPYPPPSNPDRNPNTYPPDPYHATSIPESSQSENQSPDPSQPPPSVPFNSDAQRPEPMADEDGGAAATEPSVDAEAVLDWAEARELEIARLEAENARLRAELNIDPAALKKAGIPDDAETYLVATSSFGHLGGHNFRGGQNSRSSSFSGHPNGVFVTASFPPQNQQQHPQHQQQQHQQQQQYSQFNPHHQQQQPFPQHHPQSMHQYGGGGNGGTPPPQMGISLQRAM